MSKGYSEGSMTPRQKADEIHNSLINGVCDYVEENVDNIIYHDNCHNRRFRTQYDIDESQNVSLVRCEILTYNGTDWVNSLHGVTNEPDEYTQEELETMEF